MTVSVTGCPGGCLVPLATPLTRPLATPLTMPLTTPLTKSPTTPSQSDAGSDSEGEYVELEELPSLSPQHGSLTQCISLRYQHTPVNTLVSTAHTPGSATHIPGHPSGSETKRAPPPRAPGGAQPVRTSRETESLNPHSIQHLPTAPSHQPAEETEELPGSLQGSLSGSSPDSLPGSLPGLFPDLLPGSLTEKLITDARRQSLPICSNVMSCGVLCLPGEYAVETTTGGTSSRDHRGGALVTVRTNSSVWWRCSRRELLDIFFYFSSISR
ncbi:hypothetical protein N1851_009167 [Merluccius polli]|uniref:Uncharacterized protein n=1 Tax=Merluccius polli TaxID=89951 RepID=A0AA47N0J2_MERPO|nr:hypothetical protein N1851_009167 [Merluccius polli]